MANHKTYQYLDLQLIDHFWNNNLVVCCRFDYKKNNKDTGIEELFNKNVKNITGHHITDIMDIIIADRAAIGISTKLDLDER